MPDNAEEALQTARNSSLAISKGTACSRLFAGAQGSIHMCPLLLGNRIVYLFGTGINSFVSARGDQLFEWYASQCYCGLSKHIDASRQGLL